MRRPPRRKDAPIINQRLLYRVVFSASIIVVETLFIYVYALSDDRMSRREQTMVSSPLSNGHLVFLQKRLTSPPSDVHMFRLSRSRFRDSEPRSRLRDYPKQDARLDGFGLIHRTAELDLRSPHAIDLPDGRFGLWGPVTVVDPCGHFIHFARD
jgi:hypothetical protein